VQLTKPNLFLYDSNRAALQHLIIAIDGYSSCGKSTLARSLAASMGLVHVDSGAMYRAITYYFLQYDIGLHDNQAVEQALAAIDIDFSQKEYHFRTLLNGTDVEEQIRTMKISSQVSAVATIPAVRRKMRDQQRLLAADKSIIMDGRDIGTVIFPDANLKLFVSADMGTRVERRYLELQTKGKTVSRQHIRRNLYLRDYIDSTRTDSPLRRAKDAILLDNTNLNQEEQLAVASTLVHLRTRST